MKTKMRAIVINIVLVTFLVGCGEPLIAGLKVALAAGKPLVRILVSTGKLTQEVGDNITQDFDSAVTCAANLQTELTAAKTKGEKLAAAQRSYSCWLEIYRRGHFGANAQILEAADIADGIFTAIVMFYGGTTGSAPKVTVPKTGADLKKFIESETKRLKQKLESR